MDWEQLVEYINLGESSSTVFISSIETEKDIGPTLTALCNQENGGIIFVGIDVTNYHLIGCEQDEKWISSLIQNFCSPLFRVEIKLINRNTKTIMCIQVPDGVHKPYTFLRRCYVRDHLSTRLATYDEEQLLREQSILKAVTHTEEQEALPNDSFSDVTPEEEEPIEPVITGVVLDTGISVRSGISHESVAEVIDDSDHVVDDDVKVEPMQIHPVSIERQEPLIPFERAFSGSTDTFALNYRQQKALEYLKTHHTIKNKQYRSLFSVSHKTAHLELVALVANKYLKSQGFGRNTCYVKATS